MPALESGRRKDEYKTTSCGAHYRLLYCKLCHESPPFKSNLEISEELKRIPSSSRRPRCKQCRRTLERPDRPQPPKSGAPGNGYAPLQPGGGDEATGSLPGRITATCKPGKNGKSPVERIGLAKEEVRMEDVIYLPG